MRQNLCHKIANESLFVGFAVALLTMIATVAYNAVWPAILILFTARAAHDFSKCKFRFSSLKAHGSCGHKNLQPLKV
jgi:hypothetical protein